MTDDHTHRFTGASKAIIAWCPECDATELDVMERALRSIIQRVGFAAMRGPVSDTERALALIANEALVAVGRLTDDERDPSGDDAA